MNKKTKIWLIAAASFVVAGCVIFAGVMTVLKWDFTRLSTTAYETNEYEIKEEYKNIYLKTDIADVVIVPSDGETTSVVCFEQTNTKHSVSVDDGTLVIEAHDTRKWYEYIGVNFGKQTVAVHVPRAEYGTVELETSTGNANITNVECKDFTSVGGTGSITLSGVVAKEKISITRSTGDVIVDASDASEISIKTDTGDVGGSLLTDKMFVVHTDTGRIDVPDSANGGRCEAVTDTGNIKFEIK